MVRVGTLKVDIEPGKALKALADANKTIDKMLIKIGEQVEDIEFLADRANRAGSCSFADDRDTGASSNSIVAIAYGLIPIEEQVFPSDASDLAACCRAFEKLPDHRKTKTVEEALFRARQFLAVKEREFGPAYPSQLKGGAK